MNNREGVRDLPILAQSLSAVFMAEWRGVLGKSGCCEEECNPIIIRDANGARHPDRNPDHRRSVLKPWLYAVGVKPSFTASRNVKQFLHERHLH